MLDDELSGSGCATVIEVAVAPDLASDSPERMIPGRKKWGDVDRAQQILQQVQATDAADETLPQVLCQACAAALPVTGVAMALMSAQGPEGLIAASNDTAGALEELQFALGDGPSVDASRHHRPVLEPHFRATAMARWPGLGQPALIVGVEAVFAFPLQVGAIRLGVLTLYCDRPGHLSSNALTEAWSFSDAATKLMLHLQGQMPAGALHPALALPGHSRPEVHQATGMISVQAAVGLAEALLLLRARAFTEDRDILAVARDVIARTLRFTPPTEDHD
ncbi:GAF domain-containing protein [Allobranchiibius huperziae]|uniref:ANTAR domain-containing protein n=1 Tax=Allobranchiibius huperziae TaxID=1874116 RepID=A0A853DLC6_9MICO|nr:GAF domain-containing protein [Allobranchiibius huperziae]NYJ74945.1 hypothetical protein [Allobranchiibius huperziae]